MNYKKRFNYVLQQLSGPIHKPNPLDPKMALCGQIFNRRIKTKRVALEDVLEASRRCKLCFPEQHLPQAMADALVCLAYRLEELEK
jgi:hypothetical protein